MTHGQVPLEYIDGRAHPQLCFINYSIAGRVSALCSMGGADTSRSLFVGVNIGVTDPPKTSITSGFS